MRELKVFPFPQIWVSGTQHVLLNPRCNVRELPKGSRVRLRFPVAALQSHARLRSRWAFNQNASHDNAAIGKEGSPVVGELGCRRIPWDVNLLTSSTGRPPPHRSSTAGKIKKGIHQCVEPSRSFTLTIYRRGKSSGGLGGLLGPQQGLVCPQSLLSLAHEGPRQAVEQHLLGPHYNDPSPHHTHTGQSFPCPVRSTGETELWRARADHGHSLGHWVSGWPSLDITRSLGHLREQYCSKRGISSKADSVLFLLQVSY